MLEQLKTIVLTHRWITSRKTQCTRRLLWLMSPKLGLLRISRKTGSIVGGRRRRRRRSHVCGSGYHGPEIRTERPVRPRVRLTMSFKGGRVGLRWDVSFRISSNEVDCGTIFICWIKITLSLHAINYINGGLTVEQTRPCGRRIPEEDKT